MRDEKTLIPDLIARILDELSAFVAVNGQALRESLGRQPVFFTASIYLAEVPSTVTSSRSHKVNTLCVSG